MQTTFFQLGNNFRQICRYRGIRRFRGTLLFSCFIWNFRHGESLWNLPFLSNSLLSWHRSVKISSNLPFSLHSSFSSHLSLLWIFLLNCGSYRISALAKFRQICHLRQFHHYRWICCFPRTVLLSRFIQTLNHGEMSSILPLTHCTTLTTSEPAWRTICPKCNTAKTLLSPPSSCFLISNLNCPLFFLSISSFSH